jgi:hypothetical protein
MHVRCVVAEKAGEVRRSSTNVSSFFSPFSSSGDITNASKDEMDTGTTSCSLSSSAIVEIIVARWSLVWDLLSFFEIFQTRTWSEASKPMPSGATYAPCHALRGTKAGECPNAASIGGRISIASWYTAFFVRATPPRTLDHSQIGSYDDDEPSQTTQILLLLFCAVERPQSERSDAASTAAKKR